MTNIRDTSSENLTHTHIDSTEILTHSHGHGDIPHDHRDRSASSEGKTTEPEKKQDNKRTLTIEEQKKVEREKAEAQNKIETEKQLNALKMQKWSREDLDAIMFKGQYKLLNGSDIKEIAGITSESAILDKDIGNPRELETDLGYLESLLNRDDIAVMKNGKVEKKEKMPPQFIDAAYGMVLTNHILSKDFYIKTGADRQPILYDNVKPETPERTKQKEALQDVLRGREWQGDSFHTDSRDKSVIIPKITTYITSAAYLLNGGQNIQNYKAGLEKKVNRDGVNLTEKEIEDSPLKAGEKSFLLGWTKPETLFALSQIQTRQKAGLLEVKSNPYFKTAEQKMAETADSPTRTILPKILFGTAALGLLAIGAMMLFGRESPTWKRFLGLFVFGGGIAFGAPVLDNMLKATGQTTKLREAATGAPITRDRAFKPLESPTDMVDTGRLSGFVNRFMARFSDADDWSEILMNPEVGPKVSTFPVGAMLSVLNPEPDSPYKDYATDKKEMEEIRATVGKLNTRTGEREKLNQLLKQSFERHRELNPKMDLTSQKKLTLTDTLESINSADGWIDKKLQEAHDMVSNEPEKLNALKVIAKHPKEWGDLTVEELYAYFIDGCTNSEIKKLLSRDREKAKVEIEDMKKYITIVSDRTKQGAKSLREIVNT